MRNLPPIRHPQSPVSGFTLIEILVSIGLLSILAGIGVSLYAITSNSYNRANRINTIRTQGSQTLEQLERSIRSATDAEVSDSTGNPVTSCSSGATSCTLTLTLPTDSIDYASSGAGCTTIAYKWVKPTTSPAANGQLTRHYDACTSAAPNDVDLFDDNTTTGVSIEQTGSTPIFTINSSGSTGQPTVTTAFTLWEGVSNSSTNPNNRANIPFTTLTSLRHY